MATKLEIADNVLMNCRTDERQVTIPADVQSVSKYAFDTCPDVHIINLHPDYVRKELTYYIKRMLSEVAEGWDSNLYVPVFPVYNIEVDIVSQSISEAINRIKENFPEISWHTQTIDAVNIPHMSSAIEKGFNAAAMYNIPLASYTEENFGILYIKGINKGNYRSLGANFDYNLLHDYKFLGYNLSERWLTIIGTETSLDYCDTLSAFSRSACWMKSPKEFIDYMNKIGKMVN